MRISTKKLQRPPVIPQTNQDVQFPFSDVHNSVQPPRAPPAPNGWNGQYPSRSPPPYQHAPPLFVPQPQPTAPPYIHHVRSEHPTPTLIRLTNFPRNPAQLPPFPAPGQMLPPWTPASPPVNSWDSTAYRAVPIYELPPADLMDYDMAWIVGIRMLPEWNKYKEDTHWNEVRQMRSAVMMQETEGDKDLNCVVM